MRLPFLIAAEEFVYRDHLSLTVHDLSDEFFALKAGNLIETILV